MKYINLFLDEIDESFSLFVYVPNVIMVEDVKSILFIPRNITINGVSPVNSDGQVELKYTTIIEDGEEKKFVKINAGDMYLYKSVVYTSESELKQAIADDWKQGRYTSKLDATHYSTEDGTYKSYCLTEENAIADFDVAAIVSDMYKDEIVNENCYSKYVKVETEESEEYEEMYYHFDSFNEMINAAWATTDKVEGTCYGLNHSMANNSYSMVFKSMSDIVTATTLDDLAHEDFTEILQKSDESDESDEPDLDEVFTYLYEYHSMLYSDIVSFESEDVYCYYYNAEPYFYLTNAENARLEYLNSDNCYYRHTEEDTGKVYWQDGGEKYYTVEEFIENEPNNETVKIDENYSVGQQYSIKIAKYNDWGDFSKPVEDEMSMEGGLYYDTYLYGVSYHSEFEDRDDDLDNYILLIFNQSRAEIKNALINNNLVKELDSYYFTPEYDVTEAEDDNPEYRRTEIEREIEEDETGEIIIGAYTLPLTCHEISGYIGSDGNYYWNPYDEDFIKSYVTDCNVWVSDDTLKTEDFIWYNEKEKGGTDGKVFLTEDSAKDSINADDYKED